MDVGQQVILGLEEFKRSLESGKPITTTTLVRKPEMVLARVRMRDNTLSQVAWYIRRDEGLYALDRAYSGPALPESSVEIQPAVPCSLPNLPSCVKFTSELRYEVKHVPDKRRLPPSLQGLEWMVIDPQQEWIDGTAILVAVPVCDRWAKSNDDWSYEISVVNIHCDEHYFSLTCQGEPWGWELSEVDFYVEL